MDPKPKHAAAPEIGEPPTRILIVRLSALGDVVHVLPLLGALRRAWPAAQIGWVVEQPARSVVQDHPDLDLVWVFPRHEVVRLLKRGRLLAALRLLWGFFRALRSVRYEVTLDPQSNLRSSLVAWLSGAPRRIGFGRRFSKERSYLLRTDRVEPDAEPRRKVERNLLLVEALGVPVEGARASLPIPEAAAERARAWVRESSGDDAEGGAPARLVAFHPGVSAFGQIKAWAPERYAALARAARDALGVRAVITWGPGERPLAERVVDASGGAALLGPETGSLLELAALYRELDAVVGSDTGPIHLAAVLGAPVVALYGPKDPAIYGPWSPDGAARLRTVWANVHCSPCRLRRCPDVICMPAIEVPTVLTALGDLLATTPAP